MVDIVNIGLRVDSLEAETARLRLKLLGGQAGKTSKATQKLIKDLKLMAKAAMAALIVAFYKAIDVFRQFDKSLKELSAITGAAGKDLEFYKKQSLEMAKATGYAASEVVRAYKLVASAKPDLLENKEALSAVTKEVLTLAKAATLDLDVAAKALGGSLNQFGADASEAARFINVLAAGAKLGASEIGDTAEAMKMAGAVAHSLGVSFEETNSAIQALASISLKGSEAGRGLRTVMLRLSTQSRDEFNPEIVGLSKALENLGSANLSTAEKVDLFGQEAITAGTALINQSSAVRDLTKSLTGTNIAYEQAAINSDTLDTRLGKMQAKWEEMSIVMVEKLLPALEGVIDLITRAADWTGKLADVVIDAGTAIGEFAAKVSLGLQGLPTYYDKSAESALSLNEQIDRQKVVVSDLANELSRSMEQYESLTKHIESVEGISSISADTLAALRAKQEELKNESIKYSGQLKKEKDALDLLNESRGAVAKKEDVKSQAEIEKEQRAEAAAQKMRDTEALLDWELDRAIEAQEEMEAMVDEKRLEQELNRAIYAEEEMERIYEQNQRKLEAEKAYHDELYNISSEFEWNIAGLKKAIKDEEYKDVVAHGLNLLMFASQNSKKMHGIYKAAAIAKTVIDTYTAAQGAYSALANIPIVGPALGIAAAAAAVVSGMARVKAIQSTSIGSSSVSSGGGSASIGSSTTGTGSATAPITTTQEQPVRHDVSIVVSGGLHSDEDVRNLVTRINEIQEDMGQVSLVTS